MKRQEFERVYLMLLLCVGFLTQIVSNSRGQQLSPLDEIRARYARWYATDTAQDIECFWGFRKDLNPKHESGKQKRFLKLNKNTLEVSPVLSEEQFQQFKNRFGCDLWGLALSHGGDLLAVNVSSRTLLESGIRVDIHLIQMASGQAEVLVADGWNNSPTCFSPDGEYLAYYSTDARMDVNPNATLPIGAGRLVNVRTKEVKTFTEPFMSVGSWAMTVSPDWLDNNRVLFRAMSTDFDFIKASVNKIEDCEECLGSKYCPYVAVADLSTGKVQRFFMPGGHCPPWIAIDRPKSRIYLNEGTNRRKQQIIRVDFNLENPTVVFEGGIPTSMKMVNGVLKYKIGSKTYQISD
jgi:hypothetical protein